MGDNRVVTFADDALFSSMDLAHQGDYLYVIPYHNGISGHKYIDLYSSEDGSYVESYSVEYYPRKIEADGRYLYLLARDGDDNFLLKYRYPDS